MSTDRRLSSDSDLLQRLFPGALQIRVDLANSADEFLRHRIETDRLLAQDSPARLRHSMRSKLGDHAADMYRCVYMMLDGHAADVRGIPPSIEEFRRDSERLMNWDPLRIIRDESWALYTIPFKAFFFFLRAYQDVTWVCLRELLDGVKLSLNSKTASMSKALSRSSPAQDFLLKAMPEYRSWFVEWRELRNQVKNGVNFGIREPQTDPGVTFNTATDEGALGALGDRIVRLREISNTLVVMRQLDGVVRSALLTHSGTNPDT